MTFPYRVMTQHPSLDPAEFIVPVDVDAATPFEAACERFRWQAAPSRADTTAVLVRGTGAAWVFPVLDGVVGPAMRAS